MQNLDAIQEIKDRADIVELISDHVVLKRSGSSHVGLCPFHKDNKPSMHVSSSKGIYKCFSCGAGGDIFKFWSEFHKKSFHETLKDLAEKYGVHLQVSQEAREKAQTTNKQIKLHELAAKYYLDKLLRASEAEHCREYLKQREINTAAIEKFKIGYAPNDPDDWGKLIQHLKYEAVVSEKEIFDAGLASVNKDGTRYFDRFRGRLMIPIHNERGQVIAFGARALKDPRTGEEANPKYLNSPDTNIYHKGSHLYGLDQAKEFIRKEDGVIVVEGYFDVISLHQVGVKNVVANQGTALTQQQAKLLAKFSDSKRIFLCFDTDRAGEQATERGVESILEVTKGIDAELRIMRVPSGKDPDELVRQEGSEPFLKLIERAPLVINYEIDKVISETDLKSPQSKGQAVKKFANILFHITNNVIRSEYIKQISERLGVDEVVFNNELKQEIKKVSMSKNHKNPYAHLQQSVESHLSNTGFEKKGTGKTSHSSNVKSINGHIIYAEDSISATEKEILVMALQKKEILEEFLSSEKKLLDENHKKILDALVDVIFENPDIEDPETKFNMLSDKLLGLPDLASDLADIALELDKEQEKAEIKRRYQDAIKKLDRATLNHQIKELIAKIKEIENQESTEDSDNLWIQLQKEKQELVSLLQEK